MDYIQATFGKKIEELKYQDIEKYFIEPKRETDILEFKSFHTGSFENTLNKLKVSISAFLNSRGGLIIWGSPIEKEIERRKGKQCVGQLNPFDHIPNIDSIISSLSNGVIPVTNNIKCYIVDNEIENKYICLLEIKKSSVPHQYNDVFYFRLYGLNQPAPYHYIEALFKQITYPDIQCFVSFDKVEIKDDVIILNISERFYNLSPLQNEEKLSYFIECTGGGFDSIYGTFNNNLYHDLGNKYINNSSQQILHYGISIRNHHQIIFEKRELMKHEFKNGIIITVSFGGKYSPRKKSQYKLIFPLANNSVWFMGYKDDINKEFIVNYFENKLAIDYDNESDFDILKNITELTGRKVI